jgi:hypothetical protein
MEKKRNHWFHKSNLPLEGQRWNTAQKDTDYYCESVKKVNHEIDKEN